MSEEAGEKKHDPGERQWQQASERGELPRSAEVNAVVVVAAGAAALLYGWSHVAAPIALVTAAVNGTGPLEGAALPRLVAGAVAASAALPLGVAAGAAVLAGGAQARGELATAALEPKWERLDVFASFKNAYLSSTPWVELGKGLARLAVLVGAGGFVLWSRAHELGPLAALPVGAQLRVVADLAESLLVAIVPAIAVVAVGDAAWSWWKTWNSLMRTDQQVRDDHKESDGDPRAKAQRKALARKMLRAGGLAAVPRADVVLTNPTHYAVALRYRRGKDAAPVVVAKGADHLALEIRRTARAAGVPIVENRPLARALHSKCQVGASIPEAYYGPVARILAVVLARRRPGGR